MKKNTSKISISVNKQTLNELLKDQKKIKKYNNKNIPINKIAEIWLNHFAKEKQNRTIPIALEQTRILKDILKRIESIKDQSINNQKLNTILEEITELIFSRTLSQNLNFIMDKPKNILEEKNLIPNAEKQNNAENEKNEQNQNLYTETTKKNQELDNLV